LSVPQEPSLPIGWVASGTPPTTTSYRLILPRSFILPLASQVTSDEQRKLMNTSRNDQRRWISVFCVCDYGVVLEVKWRISIHLYVLPSLSHLRNNTKYSQTNSAIRYMNLCQLSGGFKCCFFLCSLLNKPIL